ncbi:hypothetical protein MLD38_014157 [Melastoma candidum]|uniref:Uncharacterized protein n=1 Tax=Melastoma candidum TaxID=119954 RepID=A0ACB9RD16_9MYRT|nr:hypothetical protein MLD38_014157 [Melastoma candidum]
MNFKCIHDNRCGVCNFQEDNYYPHPMVQDMLWGFLHNVVEPLVTCWPFSIQREKALKIAIDHIHYEDWNSRYLCIGAVLFLLACWVEDANSEAYKFHLARIPDYYWIAEDGMKMQALGSQLWDVALAVQAILSADLNEEYASTLRKSHDFVKASQVQEDPPDNFEDMYRHISKGAWTLRMAGLRLHSRRTKGLVVMFQVVLLLSQLPAHQVGEMIETERLFDAVNVILSLQSKNGGFPAWEASRGYAWLELFNPTELFEDVIIDKEYVECTASVIQALMLFKNMHPQHRQGEIKDSISNGIHYIEDKQNPDGSWYGCWGICYTYGTWFAVRGLVACGRSHENSSTLRQACKFLLSKQLPCGGWGESYLSSQNKVYTNLDGDRANLVQTAWAVLALIDAGQGKVDPTPIHRGIRVLMNSQMSDGDFPQQEITGVFNRNCTQNYSAYRNIFPIWAIGDYRRRILFA